MNHHYEDYLYDIPLFLGCSRKERRIGWKPASDGENRERGDTDAGHKGPFPGPTQAPGITGEAAPHVWKPKIHPRRSGPIPLNSELGLIALGGLTFMSPPVCSRNL